MKNQLIFFLSCLLSAPCMADQYLDSLWGRWENEALEPNKRMMAMVDFAWDGYLYSNPDSAIYYAQLLYDYAEEQNASVFMADALNLQGLAKEVLGDLNGALEYYDRCKHLYGQAGEKGGTAAVLVNIGSIYESQADYPRALKSYMKSLHIYEELDNQKGVANSYNNIGVLYQGQKEYDKALENFQKGLELFETLGEKRGIANAYQNIGIIHFDRKEYEQAIEFYDKSLALYNELDDKWGAAAALNNKGSVYEAQRSYPDALSSFDESLKLYQALSDKSGVSRTLQNIGNLHNSRGESKAAIPLCQQAYQLAKDVGGVREQRDACKCLYQAYKQGNDAAKALEFHEQLMVFEDSLEEVETFKALRQMEFRIRLVTDSLKREEEVLRVQMEHDEVLHRKERTKNISMAVGIILLILTSGLLLYSRSINKAKDQIESEKNRSEDLLLNILPAEIAEELKEKGSADARSFENVSILFTDFKSFTKASETLSAVELVDEINTCFEAFDRIVDKYGIEKIKTIGDSYMAAGGLPVPSGLSVQNTVKAGLEMQAYIINRKAELEAKGKPAFSMRIGIHTGPVVAGIVGKKKFQYDIWGDTVNTANRMESAGEVGKVNVSEATYQIVKDRFEFDYRGEIEAKGKGKVKMYFAREKKVVVSMVDGKPTIENT
ncbi:MAG: tetratricopeptide repeat protein [Flavobacteriales bacterium]|nr:tetratricopeptide repeat protein [Flavobacteriales bacterium]